MAAVTEIPPNFAPAEAPLSHRLARRATEYARLMRLDKPIGTWLLLWPALWALWVAGAGRPEPRVLIVFVVGVVVMRAVRGDATAAPPRARNSAGSRLRQPWRP